MKTLITKVSAFVTLIVRMRTPAGRQKKTGSFVAGLDFNV